MSNKTSYSFNNLDLKELDDNVKTLRDEIVTKTARNIQNTFLESKELLLQNVLRQLGYNVGQVYLSQGKCVVDVIYWEKHDYDPVCEYLCVNNKRVGEVGLVWENYTYSVCAKTYEEEV